MSAAPGSVSAEQPFGEWTRHEAAPSRFEPSACAVRAPLYRKVTTP